VIGGGEGSVPGVVSVAGRTSEPAEHSDPSSPGPNPTSARHWTQEPPEEENHTRVIRLSVARGTHLSTGFSSCGSAGRRHSDKESSGTTSGSAFPTGFPLEAWRRGG